MLDRLANHRLDAGLWTPTIEAVSHTLPLLLWHAMQRWACRLTHWRAATAVQPYAS